MSRSRKSGQTGSKSGQDSQSSLRDSLAAFDPDIYTAPAVGLLVDVLYEKQDVPMHRHIRGQLVLTLRGTVTCELADGLWLVPSDCALWIPGGCLHRSIVSADGAVCYLYVAPQAAALPSVCCTLSLTPLVRELIRQVSGVSPCYGSDSADGRLAAVLLEQLAAMNAEQLHLPMTDNPRLRRVAEALLNDPANRKTAQEWAAELALSERSLRRLVQAETGMTFGQWRQQFQLMLALQALASGATVQAVSDVLGYESPSAFTTMFKKAMGAPPRRYARDREDRIAGRPPLGRAAG